jgi:hypothetical protein
MHTGPSLALDKSIKGPNNGGRSTTVTMDGTCVFGNLNSASSVVQGCVVDAGGVSYALLAWCCCCCCVRVADLCSVLLLPDALASRFCWTLFFLSS